MGGERFRFGALEFDPASGELRRLDAPEGEVQRLAHQPALLLALLAERRGAIVGREEIRARIWPDVSVDFESSLHFCVRQVRVALADSGADPRYVENVPRRGYRLKPRVTLAGEASPGQRAARGPAVRAGIAAAVVLVVAAGAWLLRERPVRIAIMPFAPRASVPASAAPPIAEAILERLDRIAGKRAEIVGPTATSAYSADADPLARLTADYDVAYVVNGRFLDDERGTRMLAELIRTADGAHVWVRSYGDLSQAESIGEEIAVHVARELGLD